nr:MAG TPA: hypothetical protein [Caudoviricetes sp.]
MFNSFHFSMEIMYQRIWNIHFLYKKQCYKL